MDVQPSNVTWFRRKDLALFPPDPVFHDRAEEGAWMDLMGIEHFQGGIPLEKNCLFFLGWSDDRTRKFLLRMEKAGKLERIGGEVEK
jgi:hypothetical protein